jgi:hypothetical protein
VLDTYAGLRDLLGAGEAGFRTPIQNLGFVAPTPRIDAYVATVPARAGLRSSASGHLLLVGNRMSTVSRRGFYKACPAA